MAEKDNTFQNTVEALFRGMDSFITTKTVVGEAIHIDDTILLPLVDVSFGVGAGAFAENAKNNAGGGMGGKISPSAVLVISKNGTRLVNIKNQDAVTKIEPVDKQGHTEQAKHNGRDAAQVIGHHPDEANHPPPFGSILIHINAAHHSYRESEQRTTHHEIKRTYNGRPDTACRHTVGRSRRQEVPTNDPYTFIYNKEQNSKEHQHDTQTQQTEQTESYTLRNTFSID